MSFSIDPVYIWIFFCIILLSVAKCVFWFFIWWRARAARDQQVGNVAVFTIHGNDQLEYPSNISWDGLASSKPPPYNSLNNCESPPAYDSIIVNK